MINNSQQNFYLAWKRYEGFSNARAPALTFTLVQMKRKLHHKDVRCEHNMCIVYHMAHYMWCIIESSPTYPPPSRRCQSRSQSLTFPWLPQLNYHSRSTTIFHYHTYIFLFFFLFSLFYSSPVRFPFPFSHEGEPPTEPLFVNTHPPTLSLPIILSPSRNHHR